MAKNDPQIDNIVLEDATILFRNFAGKPGRFNKEGDRSFCVILNDSLGEHLLDEGWNVKWLKPRDEEESPKPYIRVSVRFENRPPRVVLVSSSGRNTLDEEHVDMLDWIDIKTCDLVLTPYRWSVNDKTGVKAYLRTMFVTIDEDPLELKYATRQPEEAPF